MNKSYDKDAYIQYKDKRFVLSNAEVEAIKSGEKLNVYFVADKINDFVVAGIKSYVWDSVKRKLVNCTVIMTVGLN